MIGPLDNRYKILSPQIYNNIISCLSEEAFISYCMQVEVALAYTLNDFGIGPPGFGREISHIVYDLSLSEVYEEEQKTQHSIRAIVNCIQKKLHTKYKPFVHLFVTSSDILDSARAMQYRDFSKKVLLPNLFKLVDFIYTLSNEYSDVVQIGRTHGRHAEPTTVGYWLVSHASRLEDRLLLIHDCTQKLIGKISGAVGTRAAMHLIIDDPKKFEIALLDLLGLKPANISTQIVHPEPIVDFMHSLISTFGVLANIADDFRHLMRSEINEILIKVTKEYVGSSTMPHKINPKDFENIKSFWKTFCPRMITCYMDQISEHQRDLTNSASQRFTNELLAGLAFAVDKLYTTLSNITINPVAIEQNLKNSGSQIISEPLYILLSLNNVVNAHEIVKQIMNQKDGNLENLIEQLPDAAIKQIKEIVNNPGSYIGDASETTKKCFNTWNLLKEHLSGIING